MAAFRRFRPSGGPVGGPTGVPRPGFGVGSWLGPGPVPGGCGAGFQFRKGAAARLGFGGLFFGRLVRGCVTRWGPQGGDERFAGDPPVAVGVGFGFGEKTPNLRYGGRHKEERGEGGEVLDRAVAKFLAVLVDANGATGMPRLSPACGGCP